MEWIGIIIFAVVAGVINGNIDAVCLTASRTTCPAPSPCQCRDGLIDCEGRQLLCVPIMIPQTGNFQSLNLRNNSITNIPDAAFSALNITTLYLDHNCITSISDFAFKGMDTLKYLYLQHNKLTFLPDALKYFLTNVAELDISFNPVDGERTINGSLDEGFVGNVARVLGNTVTTLRFGDPESLVHWPRTLNHFPRLKVVQISGLNKAINYIPPFQFYAFEYTLETLWIENTHLLQMPHDIGNLRRLKELYFRYNEVQHGNDIINDIIFVDIGDTLDSLALEYDNLTKSPTSFKYLVNLRNLSLAGNPLTYVSDESVYSMSNGKLKVLNLSYCSLKRPPAALSNISSLEELDLSGNEIVSLERHDVSDLPNLTVVSFSGNPIIQVSRTAFYRLPSLTKLILSNTKLTVIPMAIQNLNSLKTLDFTNARIDCTCDMFWLKRWLYIYNLEIYIKGECENVDYPVLGYTNSRIPLCAQYIDSPFG